MLQDTHIRPPRRSIRFLFPLGLVLCARILNIRRPKIRDTFLFLTSWPLSPTAFMTVIKILAHFVNDQTSYHLTRPHSQFNRHFVHFSFGVHFRSAHSFARLLNDSPRPRPTREASVRNSIPTRRIYFYQRSRAQTSKATFKTRGRKSCLEMATNDSGAAWRQE